MSNELNDFNWSSKDIWKRSVKNFTKNKRYQMEEKD